VNAERLIAHYEQIGDASDAVPRLRRFVLDLAVRGKLAPQNPNDEPASELLKRVAIEKALMDVSERRKTPRARNAVPTGTMTPLPTGWARATLSDLVAVLNGRAYNKSELLDAGPTPVLRVGNLFTSDKWYYSDLKLDDDKYCDNGDLIFAWSASFGPFIWDGGRAIYHYHIWKLSLYSETNLSKLYLYNFLLQKTREIKEAGHGISMIHMTKEKMEQIDVPIPPLAEQYRIIAKIDELMALCDRLEAACAEREISREAFTQASLARLSTPKPETFSDDTRLALSAMPALSARPDQVKLWRQTILNLAVRGKLAPQDSNDESPSELLKRISAEKARLVNLGNVRKEKSIPPISTDTQPFQIPETWEWIRLDTLCRLITKGSSPKWQGVSYVKPDEGLLFITSENVGNYTLRKLNELKYVESRFREIEPRSMLQPGDILLNLVGASIGRTALYNLDVEANINQAVALLRLIAIPQGPSVEFLLHYFNSPIAIDLMLGSRVTTAQPNISLTDAREFPIPLPPLGEQHRIVAKVSELMKVCDELEASLTAADDTRGRLLDALLAEALSPAERELDAAE
jgi:type I restriction enzyme S subunit